MLHDFTLCNESKRQHPLTFKLHEGILSLCLNTAPWRRISQAKGHTHCYSRKSMYIKFSFKLQVFYPRRKRPSSNWIWSWFSLNWWCACGDEHITDTAVSLSFVFQVFAFLQSSSRSIFDSSCPFISPITKVNSSVIVSSLHWAWCL